jgi:hypothetical protein
MKKNLLVLFSVSSVVALIFHFLNTKFFRFEGMHYTFYTLLCCLIYMWIPGLLALLLARKENIRLGWIKKPNRYFWMALFFPILFGIVGLLSLYPLSLLGIVTFLSMEHIPLIFLPNPFFNFVAWGFVALAVILVAILSFNLFAAMGEELFWRGYLFEKSKYLHFWKSAYLIGVVWAIWHIPMIFFFKYNYPYYSLIGSLMIIACCIPLAPIMSYMRIKGESVLVPAILHAGIDIPFQTYQLFNIPITSIVMRWIGFLGFFVLVCINWILVNKIEKEAYSIKKT